jgi:CRISPR-associated endonuclease/helicase Cas3
MNDSEFEQEFERLTGNAPLSWQRRMFHKYFESGDLCDVTALDLPTGLGKTMVMALWLIARADSN